MSVSEPGKIITPWAESGLKNTIPPAANPATGRAGFDQGFSAINMTAKEAGGIPPFGQDFNGIFYEVTNILRYMQAGGQPTFDAALATAIGGYPKGAMVLGSDGVTLWQSKVDSNFTDPDTDPSSWGTFDIGLKADLAAIGGAGLIGGLAKPVTWVGFAGGADKTGVLDSLAAFNAANSSQQRIYIPAGIYNLSADVVSHKFTSWEMEIGVQFTGPGKLRQVPWFANVFDNGLFYLENACRYTHLAKGAGIGIYASAHTGDPGTGGAGIGVASSVYNDANLGKRTSVWGYYASVVQGEAAIGAAHGAELNISNLHPEVELYPNRIFSNGQCEALWLGSGGDLTDKGLPLTNASCAIGIICNDKQAQAKFLKGIIFETTSIVGTDGLTGQAIAIALGNRQAISWYNNDNSRVGELFCSTQDPVKGVRQEMSDFGVMYKKVNGGQTLFNIESNTTTPANYLSYKYGSAGNPITIAATGSDTDVSMLLTTKGAGIVTVTGASFAPGTANATSCGTSLRPWSGGFTQTAFTVTSDEREKTVPIEITDAMRDAAAEVDWVQYQYLDRVEAKGPDGARWHFGAVAQRYVEAFARHGLDAHEYGFICRDEWDASPEVINTIPAVFGDNGEMVEPERNEVVSKAVEAGYRYGIRYEEALALEAALQRRNYQRLLARIEALERS